MSRLWFRTGTLTLMLTGIVMLTPPVPARGAEVLKIGAPLAATGKDAREGALAKQGYDLWAETVNAHGGLKIGSKTYTVKIVYYDDQSKPQISAELTDKLISQDHVSLLLGHYGSLATFADAAIAEKYRVPMVEANGAARKIFAQGLHVYVRNPQPGRRVRDGDAEDRPGTSARARDRGDPRGGRSLFSRGRDLGS